MANTSHSIEGVSNKELLLNAALDRFSEHGFAGTRVDDIAKAAGVNVRLVYHYFGGKEEIYMAVLGNVFDELRDLIAGFPLLKMNIDEDSLKGLFTQFFKVMLKKPHAAKLIVSEIISGSEHLIELKKRTPELFEPVFERAVALFRSILGSKRSTDDDDALWLLSLAGMTSFLAAGFESTKLFLGEKFAGPERWEEAIYRAVSRVVGKKED